MTAKYYHFVITHKGGIGHQSFWVLAENEQEARDSLVLGEHTTATLNQVVERTQHTGSLRSVENPAY